MTGASLREVAARNERGYTQWVYDVLDSWLVSSEGEEPVPTSTFDDPRFGNISVKDRRLLQDALDVGCDAFMTIERKLSTVALFEKTTGLRIMRPTATGPCCGRSPTCTADGGFVPPELVSRCAWNTPGPWTPSLSHSCSAWPPLA